MRCGRELSSRCSVSKELIQYIRHLAQTLEKMIILAGDAERLQRPCERIGVQFFAAIVQGNSC